MVGAALGTSRSRGIAVGKRGGHVQIKAVAFSAQIQSRPLDWPTPMRDLLKSPETGDFVWRRLQYVFGLEDPADFPALALAWTEQEREILKRFAAQGRGLARSALLGADDAVTVSIADETDEETVDASFSDPDITTGFMVLVRQCANPNEEASFGRVVKLVGQRLHDAGERDLQLEVKEWRKAGAKLQTKALEELVQEQMVMDRLIPATSLGLDGKPESNIVRATGSPRELLQTHWYSGQIHWNQERKARAMLEADPFLAALADLEARQAAADLGHFNSGFAVLVERLLSSQPAPQ